MNTVLAQVRNARRTQRDPRLVSRPWPGANAVPTDCVICVISSRLEEPGSAARQRGSRGGGGAVRLGARLARPTL